MSTRAGQKRSAKDSHESRVAKFLCRSDFKVDLPNPQHMEIPKLLTYPYDKKSLVKFSGAMLDLSTKLHMPLPILKAVPINTVDPYAYAVPKGAVLDADDERLLREPVDSSLEGLQEYDASELPFLKTADTTIKPPPKRMEEAHETAEATSDPMERILYEFEVAKEKTMKHPTKEGVYATSVTPILPLRTSATFSHILFQSLPRATQGTSSSALVPMNDSVELYNGDRDGSLKWAGQFTLRKESTSTAYCLVLDMESNTAFYMDLNEKQYAKKKPLLPSDDAAIESIPEHVTIQ